MKEFESCVQMAAVQVPPTRLQDSVMADVVFKQLEALHDLGTEADAQGGYMLGLSRALASALVDDLQDGAQESALAAFQKMTLANIAELRKGEANKAKLLAALKGALGVRKT